MTGKMIVFEGMTGSGKKTHIGLVRDRLKSLGKEVVLISFPDYETEIARLTKRSDIDPYTSALLFAADRARSQERIKGLLDRGVVIIADRYCYSNFAYQSAKGVSLQWLMEIEKNIIKPNMVVFIDVPMESKIDRVKQANIEDFTKNEMLSRMQKEREISERIRGKYLQLAKTDRESKWVVVDGTKPISENHEYIWDKVSRELSLDEY
jgi:dTMP kinase